MLLIVFQGTVDVHDLLLFAIGALHQFAGAPASFLFEVSLPSTLCYFCFLYFLERSYCFSSPLSLFSHIIVIACIGTLRHQYSSANNMQNTTSWAHWVSFFYTLLCCCLFLFWLIIFWLANKCGRSHWRAINQIVWGVMQISYSLNVSSYCTFLSFPFLYS